MNPEQKPTMKAYIQIDAAKELPEKTGNYHTEHGILHFDLKLKDFSGENSSYDVDYWLKEIPFMEIMIGFAEYLGDNYRKPFNGLWVDIYPGDTYTTNQILTQYLLKEGIITEEKTIN